MHKIALVIPFYFLADSLRHLITEKLFKHYSTINIEVYGVGSENELSHGLFSKYFEPSRYLEYPQYWSDYPSGGPDGLGEKFDASLQFMLDNSNADFYIICGSDDFIRREYFELDFADDSVSGFNGDYTVYDIVTKRIGYINSDKITEQYPVLFTSGAGVVYPRKILEKIMDHKPYSRGNNEIGLESLFRTFAIPQVLHNGMDYLYTVKTAMSLNTYALLESVNLMRTGNRDDFIQYIDEL